MPCNAVMGMESVTVVNLATKNVFPPSIPRFWVDIHGISEIVIVNHSFFKRIAMRSSCNIRNDSQVRIKKGGGEFKWRVNLLFQEPCKGCPGNYLYQISQDHKTEITVTAL